MKLSQIAMAVLAVGLLSTSSLPLVDEAEARDLPFPTCIREPCGPIVPCVYGSDPDCIIRIVCVTEPCEPERFPPSP